MLAFLSYATQKLLLVANYDQLTLQKIFKKKKPVSLVLVPLKKKKLTLPQSLVSCFVALLADEKVTLHFQV